MSALVLTVTTIPAKCLLWSRASASSHKLPHKAGATTMPISQMRKIKFPVHSHTTKRWRSWAVSPGRLAEDLYSSSGEGTKCDLIQSHPVLDRFWIKPTSSWSPRSQKFHSTELTKKWSKDFPAGPVVKNPCDAGDSGLIPGRETKIPHATEQLRPCATAREPECATKTQHSQKATNLNSNNKVK